MRRNANHEEDGVGGLWVRSRRLRVPAVTVRNLAEPGAIGKEEGHDAPRILPPSAAASHGFNSLARQLAAQPPLAG